MHHVTQEEWVSITTLCCSDFFPFQLINKTKEVETS